MGYTFLSNINFSIHKSQEKYYFSNLNTSLGHPPPLVISHAVAERT